MDTGSEPRRTAARELAARHVEGGSRPAVGESSLLAYAERPRPEHDRWGLRSALVRLAQPEPEWAGRILAVVRRVDAAIGPLRRRLDDHTVVVDPALDERTVSPDEIGPTVDSRVTDLARLAVALDPAWRPATAPAVDPAVVEDVLAGYSDGLTRCGGEPLASDELAALPLVVVCVALDRLADAVAAWAVTAPGPAPLDLIEGVCDGAWATLDACGAPLETRRPSRGRRTPA
ncbi:MAG: hypothetical protein ACK5RL_09515 [Acidimicrobiales bacterium]